MAKKKPVQKTLVYVRLVEMEINGATFLVYRMAEANAEDHSVIRIWEMDEHLSCQSHAAQIAELMQQACGLPIVKVMRHVKH